jgi:hypothetical protein
MTTHEPSPDQPEAPPQADAAAKPARARTPGGRGGPRITKQTRAMLENPPADREALARWVREHLEVDLPSDPLLEASTSPLDYLAHAFFEGRVPGRPVMPADCVVWANRGGGKTFLGALATALDLIYKPGIEIRILGGSLEQSQRLHHHLRRFFERPALAGLVSRARGATTGSRLRLTNKSSAEILAQSQTAVRGTRVQKLRCDEVDLFDPEVWTAAQLVTRSMRRPGPWGQWVRGSVEALSTMHRPSGLMWDIVSEARRPSDVASELAAQLPAPETADAPAREAKLTDGPRRALFRWGVIDTLELCPPERACAACALHPECQGRAKSRPEQRGGHVTIDDALTLKGRVGQATWDAEMLCLRPRRDDSVVPEFDADVHVFAGRRGAWGESTGERAAEVQGRTLIAGMDFGFRAPTVILWATVDESNTVRVIDERSRSGVTLEHHARALLEHPLGVPAWMAADPAGHQHNDQTGRSNIVELRKHGLVVRTRGSTIQEGLRCLRDRLRPATGSPTLLISSRCVRLIESLQRYRYPEGRPEAHEPVKDGHDHAVDALRYMILNLDRPHRTVSGSYLAH